MSVQLQQLPDTIIPLLEGMRQLNASDLHLKVGVPPFYRIAGELRRSSLPSFTPGERQIERLMEPIIPKRKMDTYEQRGSLDFAYYLPSGDRFRINVLRSYDQMHAAIRRVKGEIPTFEELHLPPIYKKLVEETFEGLIMVVGVTGCGKSSTMAAMIDHINAIRADNIISVEDPIEYSFTPKKSIISQRELGIDLATFADGVRSAVRQDPDIIFVGEMRDRDTVLAGIQAAETGHLVFGTLHTADTMQAMTRMLEFFPREEQDFVRHSLANVLQAILAQRLLPCVDEQISRVPATEVLIADSVVREKIRENHDKDLPDLIATNTALGMRSYTHSLKELIETGMIYTDVAMENAPNREQLSSALHGIKLSAQTMVHRIKKH